MKEITGKGRTSWEIVQIIKTSVKEVGRTDLLRETLCGFSSADDKRYDDLKRIIGPWHLTPKELMPGAKTVISYFVPFTKEV
ncbi:MAG: hypothetical protein U0M15_00735 [Bacillota bacterium]|nr:hypothetical protein [Bacillota bacterium]